MASQFVKLDASEIGEEIYSLFLGSCGSDIVCTPIIRKDNTCQVNTFTPSQLQFSEPIFEDKIEASSEFYSVDRVGLFTVLTLSAWSGGQAQTQFALIRDDKIALQTVFPRRFTDFKGGVGVGFGEERENLVAIFDMTGKGNATIISEHKPIEKSQAWWPASVLSLSENTALIHNITTKYLFDARIPSLVMIKNIEIRESSASNRGVIAGCSIFFCGDKSPRTDSANDKLLSFTPAAYVGIAPGHAWSIGLNHRFRSNRTILSMFAWHPAHGSLAVIIGTFNGSTIQYQVLIVNPKTLSYAELYLSKPKRQRSFLAPGHICGQPVIMQFEKDQVSVLV